MQMTPELLRRYADTAVEKLTVDNYTILAVYLTGAMTTEANPFLGGTADIDLVFIHIGEPEVSREVQKINEDVHLDISHHPQRDYSDRVALRTHPWLGPILSEAVALHDPQHFMGLIQASVRGLFHRPENAIQRSKTQINTARERWNQIQLLVNSPGAQEISEYMRILASAANAIALLVGDPLTDRRFLIKFQTYAERIGRPGLYQGLLGMLGGLNIEKAILENWVNEWKNAFKSLPEEGRPPSLHPYRYNYIFHAFDSILESNQPENVLWPLIRTWTLGADLFPDDDPGFQLWKDACHQIGLLGTGFTDRIAAMDAFLEQIEEVITEWGIKEGA